MTETAMADLENVACNLCGGRDFKPLYRKPDEFYLRDDWFQVVACKSCGLGFVNPRPTVMAIQRYYPGDYFTYHFKSELGAFVGTLPTPSDFWKRRAPRLVGRCRDYWI